jgi:hypothetical protein
MTALTPVYGLEYIVQGEPLRNARPALESSMKKVEAALLLRGVVPPGAVDAATLSGRISVLENSTNAWADLPLSGLAHDDPNPRCRYRKENGTRVRAKGWAKAPGAIASGAAVWGALPAALCPAVPETVWAVRGTTGAMVRIDVATNGSATIVQALSAGEYINFGTVQWPLG